MATPIGPFEYARRGDVDYFKQVDIHVLENSRNDRGDSVLHEAAMENHLECCMEIHRRSPSLIYHKNSVGNTPLHSAAWKGKPKIVEFLLYADSYLENQDSLESGRGEKIRNKKLLLMVNGGGATALHLAVYYRNIETARALIQADPSEEHLSIVNNKKKTALHYAVQIQVLEMVELFVEHEPDFVYHADDSGATPLMIARKLAQQLGNSVSVNIRKLLIEKQASQLNARVGANGWSLLHFAAKNGDIDAIDEILQFGSDCLEVVDNNGNNLIHSVVIHGQVNVLEQLLKREDIPKNVLNAQNNFKDTPLHIAVDLENTSMALCLLYDHRASKRVKNGNGDTALDLINFEFDKERAGVYGVRDLVNEEELKEQSSFDLVVCALIATVSFTAGITVPGGFFSDGPNRGMAVLSKKTAFGAFIIANTWALLLALSAVFCHFCTRLMHKKKDIDFLATLATFCTLGAIFTMVVAFVTGSCAVLSISRGLTITVCVSSGSFCILAFYAICKVAIQYKRRNGGPSAKNYIHIA